MSSTNKFSKTLCCLVQGFLVLMAENKKIEIEYLATAKDHRRVLFWYGWKKLAVMIGVVVLGTAPVLYWAFFSASPNDRPPGFILWFLLILPLLIPLIFFWGISRQAERLEKIFEKAKVIFNGQGLKAAGESAGEMRWDEFYRVYETKQDFIFFPEEKVFYTIPKRFFPDQDQISEFRELLREKLDNRARLQN